MCDLTPDEDAVYHEYLRLYMKDGKFNGDIAKQTAGRALCHISVHKLQYQDYLKREKSVQ